MSVGWGTQRERLCVCYCVCVCVCLFKRELGFKSTLLELVDQRGEKVPLRIQISTHSQTLLIKTGRVKFPSKFSLSITDPTCSHNRIHKLCSKHFS